MTLPRKILVVDDEPDICYFLTNNLSKRGYVTSYAHSLSGAEEQLKSETPSVMLLDNHLPDGRGVDFAARINGQYPNLKIIMITAHDSAQDRVKAYDHGISFFLSKPFTIAAVNQVVDLVTSE